MFGYAKWKAWTVILVSTFGILFALPSLLPQSVYNLAPQSVQSIWHPITLGLDLRGGSSLLLEVETPSLLKERLVSLSDSIRSGLLEKRIRFVPPKVQGEGLDQYISFKVLNATDVLKAKDIVRKIEFGALDVTTSGNEMKVVYTEVALNKMIQAAVSQSIDIVRRRIDDLGTKEPSIQRQGQDRIQVQLPGVQDPAEVKALIGKTAKMSFHLVDEGTSVYDAQRGKISPDSMLIPGDDYADNLYVVKRLPVVSGEQLETASASYGDSGEAVVAFGFKSLGARRFATATRENIGKRLAIVLDGKVISAPVINSAITGGRGIITGNFTVESAADLALLLRSGALPAPLAVIEEKVVGPGLGADSIQAGLVSCLIGTLLVFGFVFLVYGKMGTFANIALILNGFLLLSVLSLFNATLTLPGLAGIALTIGMAVDSNILVFERMRDEVALGRAPLNVIHAGFENSFSAIFDSQLTTLTAALILFWLGSGPVKGFGVTLGVGILTTMFTALLVTKFLMLVWYYTKKPKEIKL